MHTGYDFLIAAARRAYRHCPTLHLLIFDYEDHRLAALLLNSGYGNYHTRYGGLLPLWFVAQEADLHAHIGQDARIQLVKADADLHRRFLAVGSRGYGAHVRRNLPVGIGIKHRCNRHAWPHARDIGFVDVNFDLVGIHINDGGNPSAREATTGRNWANHFAALSVLRNHYAVEWRAHYGVVQILLRHLNAALGGADLSLGGGDARFQTVNRCARGVERLITGDAAGMQAFRASQITLGIGQVYAQVGQRCLSGVAIGFRGEQLLLKIRLVKHGEHLPGLDPHAF